MVNTGEIIEAFKAARAAGDLELANAIKSHTALAQRSPQLAEGNITLVLRDGRRVPLRSAKSHIKRTGRTQPKPAAPGSLLDTIQKLSAQCRAITSQCDQERIAAVLASEGGEVRRQEPKTCEWCGGDWFDEIGECNFCDE
ncbi:hypothetical protein FTUN_0440 [Frigoriglobus tundricola]|uniref:Uncharacterized protein n=2 Tax=Frigoriglobus tundricola TaxID=2774151 RepID=A0A6M5YIZ7_9BACT|nr:hypothetical protein FTUN_0440 [Frigoriglobus tundricola]